jgi:hypothetical protein
MPDDDELPDDQQRMIDAWRAMKAFAGLHFWYDRRRHEQFIQHNNALFWFWDAEDAARRKPQKIYLHGTITCQSAGKAGPLLMRRLGQNCVLLDEQHRHD